MKCMHHENIAISSLIQIWEIIWFIEPLSFGEKNLILNNSIIID